MHKCYRCEYYDKKHHYCNNLDVKVDPDEPECMAKLIVQRLVKVWIENIYNVKEINKENIEDAINHDIDYDSSEILYETLEDLGPVEVFDENMHLLAQKEIDLTHE